MWIKGHTHFKCCVASLVTPQFALEEKKEEKKNREKKQTGLSTLTTTSHQTRNKTSVHSDAIPYGFLI